MQKNEKFFIFSWKELVVLGLLITTLIGFFFTLGLHYGKKVRPETPVAVAPPSQKLEESPETVPSRETLDQGSQHVESASQEALKEATEESVKNSGIHVENPRPVDLPHDKVAPKKHVEPTATTETHAQKDTPHFAVQLGSYPNRKEASVKISALVHRGIRAEVRTAEVNGETRFRVVIPGFRNRKSADLRGKELRAQRKIDNFVVIKSE